MRPLNYGRHLIDDDDIDAVISVLRGDLITQGPVVERFEADFAKKVGARHAVAVTSGTAALHIACLAADIKQGDLGVTSAMTFVASANALRYCGADVALTDIDPATLNMAPESLQQVIATRPEVSAVIPVHFAGLSANSEEIRDIVGDRIIIEDAAHALGARHANGRPVGCCDYADMATFSFHPVKPITSGEGGMVTTNDDELARRLRLLRTHGIEKDVAHLKNPAAATDGKDACLWYYEQQSLGFNYRLTDIQAALGLSQLKKLDRFIARRREIVANYDAAFAGLANLGLHQNNPEQRANSGHHIYIVNFNFGAMGISRAAVVKHLVENNVGCQVHYIPVHHQPYYASRISSGPDDFPVTEQYYKNCLTLPLFPDITDEEIDRVISAVTELAGG